MHGHYAASAELPLHIYRWFLFLLAALQLFILAPLGLLLPSLLIGRFGINQKGAVLEQIST
jgi:hypothetical protein